MSSTVKRARSSGSFQSRGFGRTRGFTLVELMIVLVILAVLLVIAVPSYSILTLRTKLKSYTNELVASVYLARGEAIKRNAPMTMCMSADGSTCVGSGDWDQGWIVLDQRVIADASDDVVIKYQQASAPGIKIIEQSGLDTITFQPSGILSAPATMTICQASPSVGIEEREVSFTTTGRHIVETTQDGCP
jgi:type IV fimbrial biogenesis protein FimT